MNASRTNCFSIELARIRISNALTSAQHCFKLRSADAETPSLQFGMDARRPIALTTVLENASDLVSQVGLDAVLRCSGLIAGLPVMEPAACHSQNRAQQPDRIGGAMGGDEGELRFHAFSAHLAKKAEAFRRISFSSWSRLLSRRTSCNSAASTLRR